MAKRIVKRSDNHVVVISLILVGLVFMISYVLEMNAVDIASLKNQGITGAVVAVTGAQVASSPVTDSCPVFGGGGGGFGLGRCAWRPFTSGNSMECLPGESAITGYCPYLSIIRNNWCPSGVAPDGQVLQTTYELTCRNADGMVPTGGMCTVFGVGGYTLCCR